MGLEISPDGKWSLEMADGNDTGGYDLGVDSSAEDVQIGMDMAPDGTYAVEVDSDLDTPFKLQFPK